MFRQKNLRRQAITLFELLLVMAILVAVAGIAIPTLDSMVTSRRLSETITQLKNELLEARVTAMRTGQAQVMQGTINGNTYSIVPWLGMNDSEDASLGATVQTADGSILETESSAGGATTSTEEATKDLKELGKGVVFFGIETLIDSRNALAIQETGGIPASTGSGGTTNGLSSPLLLYPDGSCTTAQIVLVDERGRRMAIQIRGITGQVTSLRLTSVDPSSVATVAP